MQSITSVKNPLVQAAKSLQSKAARDESGLFVCEGEHMVAEALAYARAQVRAIFVDKSRAATFAKLTADFDATGGCVYVVSEHVLAAISQVKTPQGIVSTVQKPPAVALEALGDRIVLLENVQDPGNVGTMIRTADAAGFHGCVLTPGCADPFSPKCLRATMGSVLRVPLAQAHSAPQTARMFASMGYAVIATALEGDDFYARAALPNKVCLIVGNEGAGVTQQTLEAATHRYRLPMRGGAESLNAAVAAAIFMYNIVNRA